MASSNHSQMVKDQQELVSFLAKDIQYKEMMMKQMACKMEHKDNLLEAAPKQMQETRLEREKLKKSECLMKNKLRDLEAEIEDLKAENQTPMVKERACNDELQAVREEAIRELQPMLSHHRAKLGIRKMGEVSRKPFEEMCLKRGSDRDWKEESAKLCSLWEENLRDPHWYPFKRIQINGSLQEAIDEEDAKLKQLRSEGNEKVYEAVVNAQVEMNEYNSSGRYPVLEVWNNKEKRKACLPKGDHSLHIQSTQDL